MSVKQHEQHNDDKTHQPTGTQKSFISFFTPSLMLFGRTQAGCFVFIPDDLTFVTGWWQSVVLLCHHERTRSYDFFCRLWSLVMRREGYSCYCVHEVSICPHLEGPSDADCSVVAPVPPWSLHGCMGGKWSIHGANLLSQCKYLACVLL